MESVPLHPSHLKSSDSWSAKATKAQKTIPNSKNKSKDSSLQQSEVRLTDLCPEDKARIGELVKRLALEKSQREESESKLEMEKQVKEKQLKRLAKENERIRNETRELKMKYDKSLEILETYKQSENMRSSWKEWDRGNESHLNSNIITQSMRATPDPVSLVNLPLSPIREMNNVGVQTVCDKEIQTCDEPYQRPRVVESPHSEAVKEIKNLKDDLFFLSESVRTCNLTSLRASQHLMSRKEPEPSHLISRKESEPSHSKKSSDMQKAEEEKIKKLIQRSEASTKRAEYLKNPPKSSDFNAEKSISIGIFEQSFNENHQNSPEKHQYSFKKEHSQTSKPSITHEFYDEGLFQLVDDLELMESRNYEFPEESDSKFSDFSEFSSKKEHSTDSLEDLRIRALRLKNTLKY